MVARFGGGAPSRQSATASLLRIYKTAKGTGKLGRFIIFGSYITAKADPNDVDIILVMADDFRFEESQGITRELFIHDRAAAEFGASVFWVRPGALLVGTLEEFIAHWQIKQDKGRRGIVEVIA